MEITARELEALMVEYFEDHTTVYFMSGFQEGDWKIDGTVDLGAMARWMVPHLNPCPCDCEEPSVYVGRWTSGSFAGPGPLRSAYTCEAHSALVAAWCETGTGMKPVFNGGGYPMPAPGLEVK